VQAGDHRVEAHGLRQEAEASDLFTVADNFGLCDRAREEDDGRLGKRGLGLQADGDIGTVEFGHLDVHDDEIGGEAFRGTNGVERVVLRLHAEAGERFECDFQHVGQLGLVVHDQDAFVGFVHGGRQGGKQG
jgi:hypothetical protein